MDETDELRPLERRVRAMADDGLTDEEIGRRVRRSPRHVANILRWTDIPRPGVVEHRHPRALEARVAALQRAGESSDRIARRFRREPGFAERIEYLSGLRPGD